MVQRRAAAVTTALLLAAAVLVALPAAQATAVPAGSVAETAASDQVPRGSSVEASPAEVVDAVPLPSSQPRDVVSLVNTPDGPEIETVPAANARQARTVVGQLQQDPDVASVSIDQPVKLMADNSGSQWALSTLVATQVWGVSTGSGVTVAVVDTGVQGTHPDLAGRVLSGAVFLNNTGTSSGNGQTDGNGHGTHVSGIVAADNDGDLVTGIAPSASILPVQVLGSNGSGYSSDVNRGILYAVDNGADIINLSLGGAGYSSTDAAVIAYATANNVAVFAAAGNNGAGAPPNYPAAYTGAIGVSATDSSNVIASFSNRGFYVDLAAPGVSIISSYPTSTVRTLSGTSMGTPYAAGSAAVELAKLRLTRPAATGADAVSPLLDHATDLGTAGRDDDYGYGLVNPFAAMTGSTYVAPVSAAPGGGGGSAGGGAAAPPPAAPPPAAVPPVAAPAVPAPGPAPVPTTNPGAVPGAPSLRSVGVVRFGKTLRAVVGAGVPPGTTPAVQSYTARCKRVVGVGTLSGSAPRSPVIVSGLKKRTRYRCQIMATNAIGGGPWSPLSQPFRST